MKNYTRPIFLTAALCTTIFTGALSSCQESSTPTKIAKVDHSDVNNTAYPSVLRVFSCKPAKFSFVAAHRGTHEGSDYPENALESLQALHNIGVPFAEVDVARIQDGTYILFHDGTWNRGSTGKGPIASTGWKQAGALLLKDTNGQITSYRPSKFTDVLNWAKDRIYLEIDFKSSVDEAVTITAIKDAGMIDQVILISYNTDQALRLHKLAPTAALSVGIFKPGHIKALEDRGIPVSVMTAWTGKGPLSQDLTDALRSRNIPILAASFFSLDDKLQISGDYSKYTDFAVRPDLVVTDFAYDVQPVLSFKQTPAYRACLSAP